MGQSKAEPGAGFGGTVAALNRIGEAAARAGADAEGSASSCVSERVTLVPHPEGLSSTTPLAPSVSHSTLSSGSTRVIVISPSSPR